MPTVLFTLSAMFWDTRISLLRAPHDGFRIYIAGPMTGIDKYNFPAFDAAAQDLRDMGFHPVSPADIDRAHGFDPTDPREQAEMHTNLRDIISRDVSALLDCDGLALLPGWQRSLGARAEVAVALWRRDMRFWDWPTMRELKPDMVAINGVPPRPQFKLIGMTGYAGSGKDTAAEAMQSDGWEVMGFADPMYKMSMVLDPLLFRYLVFPFRLSRVVRRRGWTAAKRIPAVRRWLQRLGTEAGRDVLGEKVWVEAMEKRWQPGGKYIVTNVRFENEAEAIRRFGGKIIEVMRPGVGPANLHQSESVVEADASIANVGDVRHLHDRMREAVKSLGL